MKRYTNFSKYFNTTPRFLIVVLGAAVEIPIVLFISTLIYKVIVAGLAGESYDIIIPLLEILGGCLGMVIGILCLADKLYGDQVKLVKARIGKDFKRRGYDVKNCLDEIEAELEVPMLAQIHSGINSGVNFIITRNWIVGTDDLLLKRAHAIRISEIVAADLNEAKNTGRHYLRLKIADKNNRIYRFAMRNEDCQREAYDYIIRCIMGYTKLGDVPIKYKRGEVSDREYKSKCLEYCFKIPEGCVLETVAELERKSTPEEIQELYAQMPSGVNVTVCFLPMDGSLKDINTDLLGTAMVESINQNFKDRWATYYGTVAFVGKQCAHSVVELDYDGIHSFSETYTYFASYCQVIFVFTYSNETRGDSDILKQAFRFLSLWENEYLQNTVV